LVDRIVYHFDLPASKMQEFLEEQDVQKRAASLHSLIELKNQLIQISKNMKDKEIDFSMN
ncbi:MAG: LON peptidase substrate-binding domain-containing protein, partial [Nitrospinaceae bacterium]